MKMPKFLLSLFKGSKPYEVDQKCDTIPVKKEPPKPGTYESWWVPMGLNNLLWQMRRREVMFHEPDENGNYRFLLIEDAMLNGEGELIICGKFNDTEESTGWLGEGEYYTYIGM